MPVNTETDAPGRVLIFDTDTQRAENIAGILAALDYDAAVIGEVQAADDEDDVAMVIGDLPGGSTMQRLFLEFAERHRALPILRAAGARTTRSVDECIDKHYCWEFDAALCASQLRFFLVRASRFRGREHCVRITGQSTAIRRIRQLIEQVADFDTTVLITGESGTGKELAAQTVHDMSHRHDRPFVPINCGAIPPELLESELFGHEKGAFTGAVSMRKGRFELAEGGTLFLDEIGDMSLEMQAKLLRVLQERTFERVGCNRTRRCNVRVVAATHRDLKARVASGEFREDLYYRLNVFPVEMPALRNRMSDLPLLIEELLKRHGQADDRKLEIGTDAVQTLGNYGWPGNVRELNNLIERLVILHPTSVVAAQDLPARYRRAERRSAAGFSGLNLRDRMQHVEKQLIASALAESDNVVAGAARLLNVRRTTLVEKISKYGL